MARGILHRGAGGLLLLAAIPLLLLAGVAGQQCGTLYEVPKCREDCGSCGSMPCCAVEWHTDLLTAREFTDKLVASIKRGGPDGLYELKGHQPNYPEIASDLYDEPPFNIQIVHMPLLFAADDNALNANRYDDVTISVYPLDGGGTRAIAFSKTRTPEVFYQCDAGTNYQGMQRLMIDAQITSYRERLLYGCPEKTPGTIPA